MINDLMSLPPTAVPGSGSAKPEQHLPARAALGAGAAVVVPVAAGISQRAVEPIQALDRAAQAAAEAMFTDREVEVTNFLDGATGRFVCTVADRRSGEILMQSPPDALLRFFASARAASTKPLMAVDA